MSDILKELVGKTIGEVEVSQDKYGYIEGDLKLITTDGEEYIIFSDHDFNIDIRKE